MSTAQLKYTDLTDISNKLREVQEIKRNKKLTKTRTKTNNNRQTEKQKKQTQNRNKQKQTKTNKQTNK
jgi:hypothetical protein